MEDQFLTIEQVKELRNLGVNLDSANFGIYNFYDSLSDDEINEIRQIDSGIKHRLVSKTLSIPEMIQMLPDSIMSCKSEPAYLHIDKHETGYITKTNDTVYLTINFLLRDSLFIVLKYLKIKKLI